jgi:hypothetical protein
MKSKTVNVDVDFEFIVIAAMRYAIGRRSYAVSLVAEYIKRQWEKLSDNCRFCLKRDLEYEIDSADRGIKDGIYKEDPLGHHCDRRTWVDLNDWMKDQKPDISVPFIKEGK